MLIVLFLFILSHLLADFVTQNRYIAKYKSDEYRKGFHNKAIIIHVIHHSLITILILSLFGKINMVFLIATLLICLIHYFIDLGKSYFSEKMLKKYKKHDSQLNLFLINLRFLLDKKSFYFFIDQLIHVFSIYLVLRMFNQVYSIDVILEKVNTLMDQELALSFSATIVSLLILFILISWASGYFVGVVIEDLKKGETLDEVAANHEKDFFDEFYEKERKNMMIEKNWESEGNSGEKSGLKVQFHYFNEEDNNSAGMFIGILERILIVLFVIFNAYQGLIVLGALKTLARFKQFDAKSFAEYYLIGTLLSIILGLIFGGVAKLIIVN